MCNVGNSITIGLYTSLLSCCTYKEVKKSYDDSVKLKRTEMDHFRLG